MVLTRSQAQAFYDAFGKKQDAQRFYEDAAPDDLVAHARFEDAANVFEFGCGTGRFAFRLLERHLCASASYTGIDFSRTMTRIAEQRISPYAGRARIIQTDGSVHFPLPDRSADRFVSTYVFDLLSESDIRDGISEAHRALIPGGKLCLAGLTNGVTPASRIVSAVWRAAFRLNARMVGGCRPTELIPYLDRECWSIEYHRIVTQLGVPSEIVIASPKQ